MKTLYNILFLITIISFASCRDDFNFEPASGSELTFSKDTVYLDTIFSNIGSSTYNLRVYNNSNKDIKIPAIRLAKGENSNFRLMVDGMPGKSFENVELLAKDSMFIFVETTVDIKQQTNGAEFLYTDEILFQAGSNQQKVNLVTLVKDAVFLYPQKFQNGSYESITINDEQVYGFFLDENDATNGNELEWNNTKPYVIYGAAAVPPGKTLNVTAGTEVHFHRNSALIAFPTSTINAQGSIENSILMQGDRLEPNFEDTPGQWTGVWIGQNSNISIANTVIKNAVNGLLINANNGTASLENVQIYNCEQFGLLLATANVMGKNVVTNNCGRAALAITNGGVYDFTHCTFANYWSRQNQTAAIIDNGDGTLPFALQAQFKNSIIYGNASESIVLVPANNQSNFNFSFDYCLIKFQNTGNRYNTEVFPYNFNNPTNYNNNLIAKNFNEHQPYFSNTQKNKMMITDKATSLINYGNSLFAQQVPNDLLGNSRLTAPDLGAYQHVTSSVD
ncbi:hypothetical protein [Paenimyroides aestuarii]|uniref:Right handed beta helix domain-containing protein n=1 Tax=Paenimyroides aestuarii TaxID=2968490 RepID=A0ABY5NPZ2_9FLAO|nr:hypothetical protein [Paenimyroides aestuarii]UUV20632.1 hypothetical protein NPX36_09775 [Paenimyroides aestuarii]